MNICAVLFVFCLSCIYPSYGASLLSTENRLTLFVERGKSAYLSQAHLPVDPKLRNADLCQIEVDDIQPLSSAVGFLKPKKFLCFFPINSVLYQHEGSSLTSSDTVFLNIYYFRKQHSSVQNVTISVSVITPLKPSRVNLNSHLTVKSWKGISQAISSNLITIRYNHHKEFCRFKHTNHATKSPKIYPWLAARFWPMTGVLVTFNKSKIYEFNMECQQALLMGFRFMHRKSRSSLLDFLPVIIEIVSLYSDEVLDLTYIHIPIHISSKVFTGISENLPNPPIIKAFRTITLTNSGGTFSLLPSDCLELSSSDKERRPLIVQILNIQGGHYYAAFRNMRDSSKTIWSFTLSDLVNGLIAFQLQSYSKDTEKIFRIDLIVMDSYFVKSNVLILKLIDKLENKDQLFQVFTTPFYTYTSSSRPLRYNNIQIVGDIDLNLVKYAIVNKNITTGSLYKYPSTPLINKFHVPNPYFLISDMKNDLIYYKHDGGLIESDMITVEVSIDRFQLMAFQLPVFIVREYNRTREALLDRYTEFSVPREGIFRLSIQRILNKQYYFSVVWRDFLDVIFDIVDQPQYGNILKLLPGQNITASSTGLSTIRFSDLLGGLIYYQNTANFKTNQDVFELKQQGRIGDRTVKIIFNIQNHEKRFLLPKMDPNIMFTVVETVQYKRLSYLNLNFVNYFLQPEDIVYQIVRFPRYENADETIDSGRLVSLKSIQNDILIGDTVLTTKITNFRSAHVTSVTSFTQKQILDNDIIYIPPLDDIGPEDRKVTLLYSVKDIDGYEITNIPFTILVKAINNQPPILKAYSIVVPRDEEISLTFANLDIRDEDSRRREIIVEFVTLPTYGVFFDGPAYVIENGYKFSAYKLDDKRIKYKHNGRNVNKDSFNIRLFDGIQTSQIYNVLINITKRVLPTSNWSLYINNSVIVKENSTVVLHQTIFKNVLKASDLKLFSNPTFIIVAMPTRGNIFNGKVVVSTFYLEEVKKGLIAYQHAAMEIGSKSQFDFTQVWVLETGESFNLNFTIQPVNSQPPTFYSQMPLQVNEGGFVIINYYAIGFVDLDSAENDITIQVVTAPIWGTICAKGRLGPIKSFSISDIKLGKIIYNNSFSGNGSEQTHDVFTIRGTDGEFLSTPVEIQIFIHSINDEPPNLFLNNFNIAVGEKRILDENLFQVFDADVPRDNIQITVSRFPIYGTLSLKYKHGDMRPITRNSPPVTLQLLKFVSFIYMQDNSTVESQNLKFPMKDQFELTVTDGKFVVKKTAHVNVTGFNRISPIILLSLIQLNKINEKVISTSELSAIDPDTLPGDIIFTLLKIPEKGGLFLRNKRLLSSQTFTQRDINEKQVQYKYLGSSVTYAKDYFLIKLFDGSFESTPKQVYIFLTQPIQIPKMSISIRPIKVNIGKRFTLDKDHFIIKNPVSDIVHSIVITIKSKLTCGGFYYYTNLDYSIVKFTFDDVQERRILLFVSECPEVVKLLRIPVSMFSHKGFQHDTNMDIGIIPRVSAVPTLKRNNTINALVGSNLLFTKEMLLTIDEDTPSDKIIYKFLNNNQSDMKMFVNKLEADTFSQFDINSERVEIHFKDDINITETNATLLVSDGENEGYIYNSYYQVSGLVVLPIVFTNWKHTDLILLRFSVPRIMKYIDGLSSFQWTYDELLVSRPEAQITIARDLSAGFFYNFQTKQSITSFTQVDINRGNIFYRLSRDKSTNIHKEIIQFKIFYQGFRISSEILELQWSIIEFDRIKFKLCPQRGLLSINVLRTGNLSVESQALIGFVSMEAIMNQDFRLMSQSLLIFAPGEHKKMISIKILMTGSVLKDNRFQVTLNSPKQTVFGKKSVTTIIIKNRKTCGNKEYFLAEKTRNFSGKNILPTNTKNMLQDLGLDDYSSETNGQDLPSSDELEMQYKYYLSKESSPVICTKGWVLYSRRCYHSFKTKLSWSKANEHCSKLDSYLVTVGTDSLLLWLTKLFPSPRSFWIGLHKTETDVKKWKYTNNEAVLYTNWETGFPKLKGHRLRHCVLVSKKMSWRNRPCESKLSSFICMKNPEVAA